MSITLGNLWYDIQPCVPRKGHTLLYIVVLLFFFYYTGKQKPRNSESVPASELRKYQIDRCHM